MFRRLTSRRRWRAATLLAALYALCLLTPTIVLAAGVCHTAIESAAADHHAMAADSGHGSAHEGGHGAGHEDGTNHQHSGNGDGDHGQPAKCCGTFCVSAIPPGTTIVATEQPVTSRLISLFAESLSGRGSDRIDRPPRSLLSL